MVVPTIRTYETVCILYTRLSTISHPQRAPWLLCCVVIFLYTVFCVVLQVTSTCSSFNKVVILLQFVCRLQHCKQKGNIQKLRERMDGWMSEWMNEWMDGERWERQRRFCWWFAYVFDQLFNIFKLSSWSRGLLRIKFCWGPWGQLFILLIDAGVCVSTLLVDGSVGWLWLWFNLLTVCLWPMLPLKQH